MRTKTATPKGHCRCRFPQANLNRYPVRCQTCGRILDAYMLLKTRKLAQQNKRLKRLALALIVLGAIIVSLVEVLQ